MDPPPSFHRSVKPRHTSLNFGGVLQRIGNVQPARENSPLTPRFTFGIVTPFARVSMSDCKCMCVCVCRCESNTKRLLRVHFSTILPTYRIAPRASNDCVLVNSTFIPPFSPPLSLPLRATPSRFPTHDKFSRHESTGTPRNGSRTSTSALEIRRYYFMPVITRPSGALVPGLRGWLATPWLWGKNRAHRKSHHDDGDNDDVGTLACKYTQRRAKRWKPCVDIGWAGLCSCVLGAFGAERVEN
ncbi:uncharacterized protein LOC101754000 [Anopheles sinensis]|uniref:Uncharacterized protein LOC101754000 n=1 Tax=Anopheles sinensis TaxID=74873 RepID=A0A084VNF5_ANOSI|nr:uncharacterized protein LOC101754000 [Anopheles sinensis]